MIRITISETIWDACPELEVIALVAKVENREPDARLWEEIDRVTAEMRASMRLEEINAFLPIRATRQAYKRLGKDPNRYRPSAEALRRRVLRDLPLYRIDTLVDVINLVSLESGFSIGGFDADKIDGDLELGVGRAGEPYEAIGRGLLNIEGLPVYRDRQGGIGTPTSDEERTKIDLNTSRLLMIINGYSGREGMEEAVRSAAKLLRAYALAADFEAEKITASDRVNIII
ncbi:DNA/RNA-binding domain of Phe-tRNA-synthetase-like protein [Parabacteroides sp. PFB2-12]|uniref:B3/B4 domain-containing protein n=1 Tax=unclassified Parabacteroides TaxID=2649774 RepID=UPI002475BBD4|nr:MULTISPECIES: phenylalanine--tRNA ligase beta subunit-related protein [unclassified Parabacteroides]MDH6341191.1 DNA/RNA-binding domain of Phe-tRNA-synthetase-like protein [Parabacteroides sp. PM6-13]MDH6389381.1 DNA/RNA-binding domain of Phe-tRNA-synthetase-like protein [Parabacteroides sp. PFB2-12]